MKGFAWRLEIGALTLILLTSFAKGAEGSGTFLVAQGIPQLPKGAPAQRGPTTAPTAPQQAPSQAPGGQPQQIPTRTEIQYFENWIVTCNEFAGGPRTRVCSALLQVVQQETNQRVFAWSITMDNKKQLVMELQTPTGVAITPGVELRIAKTSFRKIPFIACDTSGCLASSPVDASMMRDMTASPTIEAVIQGRQGNIVEYNIEMKGFEKAMAVLSRS
jgi:invasion protein IalB